MKVQDLVTYRSFEIPKNSSDDVKNILDMLDLRGFVVVNYDDGPGKLVIEELKKIAGLCGINTYQKPYELLMVTDDGVNEVKV